LKREGLFRTRDVEDTVEEIYFPVSPFMIFPEAYIELAIYLKKGRNYILLANQAEYFNERNKSVLHENGVEEVYLKTSQRASYDAYIEQNLARLLWDLTIPLNVRSEVLYYSATKVLGEIFESSRYMLSAAHFQKLFNIARSSVAFFSGGKALRTLLPVLNPVFAPHTHCANVFIFSLSIFETFPASENEKAELGLGALLHDIGQSIIPKMILNKRGKLNTEERELVRLHPIKGVSMCSQVPIGQTALNCILFHHEKGDGSGYPAGLAAHHIPLPAKIVGLAHAYAMLTSKRAKTDPLSPIRALSVIRDNMEGCYDFDLIQRLTTVLTAAGVEL